jgi:2-polyprenyl-6-hydroxyphenyl methylase/3-demethylubiquinone-9 3-methyltransferase
MTDTAANVDPEEIAKFERQASRWWDTEGEFKPLHAINPLRLGYIESHGPLNGLQIVDVGCGGGILSEGMAARGATVTGIDLAEAALSVARLHLHESGLQVDYRCIGAEQFALQRAGEFDVVTCMELLEHVPDPASTIRACAQLVKPGGRVFLSTLNRNPKAYLFAILGAEYLLRLLPRGTHDYARFIKPSELEAWVRAAGLRVTGLRGMQYHPLTGTYSLGGNLDVNYLAACVSNPDA